MSSESLQKAALQALITAEAAGAERWALDANPISFREVQDLLKRANSLHDQRLFAQSASAYQSVIDGLNALNNSRPDRLTRALQQSEAAYRAGDADLALQTAELAVLLDPESDQAKDQLRKAQNLPKILEALERARLNEEADNLSAALSEYAAAYLLAPERDDLRGTIARLRLEVDQRAYQLAIASSLSALARQDHTAASGALEQARRLKPNSPEVQDITRRLRIASQTANLEALQRQAIAFEQQERWSEALNTYERALKLDQMASFALRGRTQAQQLVQLNQELDRYLSEPKRLYSAEPLTHAQSIAKQRNAFADKGPKLQNKLDKLDQLIRDATTPISVKLQSDEQTEVTIYRVGRLAPFLERDVSLRPGSYTLVGTRTGYRDIRLEIDVEPAASTQPISIKCVEALK